MFGFLKKKLKEAVEKITKKTGEEADVVEEIKEEVVVKKEIKEKPNKISKTKISNDDPKPKPISDKEEVKEETKGKKIEEKRKEIKKEPTQTKVKISISQKNTKEKKLRKKEINEEELLITYFVHSTTNDNEQDKFSGQNQVGLSNLGKKQAEELKNQIEYNFDYIFCSDLNRAKETTKIIFPNSNIIYDERLRECDFGDLTGLTHKDIFDQKPELDGIKNKYPNGESYKDVEKRIKDFLNECYEKYKGKHIAIIAHKYTQLAIEVLLSNKSWEQAIESDWRKEKKWQPGWEYIMSNKLKKSIFDIFKKKPKEEIEIQPEINKIVVEEKEKKISETNVSDDDSKPKKVLDKTFFEKITETVTKVSLSDKKFEEIFWDLEVTLLENNVAIEVIEKIKQDLKKELVENKVSRKEIENRIIQTLTISILELFDVPSINILEESKKHKPYVIMFVGINGAGKTTTLAKFIHLLKKNNKTCVVGACDTFRAAAIQQLQEHTDKLGVKIIKHDYGADPAAVAFDTISHAKAKDIDVVLIDTAGRLHSNKNLMQELEKINRVAKPHLKIFIGESLAGNDVVEQVKLFNEQIGIDGIILSKADTDEKGGAAISVSYVTGKPILYLGVGQTYEDLEEFDKNKILKKLELI